MFWNNVKQHGIKTLNFLLLYFPEFWNNDKPHGVKTFENILHRLGVLEQ